MAAPNSDSNIASVSFTSTQEPKKSRNILKKLNPLRKSGGGGPSLLTPQPPQDVNPTHDQPETGHSQPNRYQPQATNDLGVETTALPQMLKEDQPIYPVYDTAGNIARYAQVTVPSQATTHARTTISPTRQNGSGGTTLNHILRTVSPRQTSDLAQPAASPQSKSAPTTARLRRPLPATPQDAIRFSFEGDEALDGTIPNNGSQQGHHDMDREGRTQQDALTNGNSTYVPSDHPGGSESSPRQRTDRDATSLTKQEEDEIVNELDGFRKEYKNLQEINKQLLDENDRLLEISQQREASVNASNSEIISLKRKLETQEQECQGLRSDHDAAVENVNALRAGYQKAEEEWKNLKKKKEEEIKRLDNNCIILTKEKQKIYNDSVLEGQKYAALEKKFKEKLEEKLREQAGEKDAEIRSRNSQIQRLQAQITQLSNAVQTKDRECAAAIASKEQTFNAQLATKSKEHAAELEKRNREITEARKEVQASWQKERIKLNREHDEKLREYDGKLEKLSIDFENEKKRLEAEHKDEKGFLLAQHMEAEQEMQRDYQLKDEGHQRDQARLQREKAQLQQDLKTNQDKYEALIDTHKGNHTTAIEAMANKHAQELRKVNQKLDETETLCEKEILDMEKSHQIEVDQLKSNHGSEIRGLKETHEKNLDSQTKALKAAIKELSAALVAKHYPKDIKQLDDTNIKTRFSDLDSMIDQVSRYYTWKSDRKLWTDQTLARMLVTEKNDNRVKKYILRDSIWSILHEHIFASPFRMFGEEGRALEKLWSGETGASIELYAGPKPTYDSERFRWMTIKDCRAALRAQSVAANDKERVRARLGFSDNLKLINEKLKIAVGEVVEPDITEEVQKLVLKASNIWLECSMQLFRIVVSLAGSEPGATAASPAEKIQQVQNGSVLLTLYPKIGRYGNADGSDFDDFVVVRNEDKIPLP